MRTGNIYPGMISYYWCDRGEEVAMIIKTRASLAEKVRAAVKEMHSYTTPAILVVPLESVDPDYHAWIEAETAEADVLQDPRRRSATGVIARSNSDEAI